MYCGDDLSGRTFDEVTVDHLKAQTKMGSNNKSHNVVTACRSCNCERQTKPWRRFAKKKGGEKAIERILRNTAKNIKKYRTHAKILLANGYADRNTHSRSEAKKHAS